MWSRKKERPTVVFILLAAVAAMGLRRMLRGLQQQNEFLHPNRISDTQANSLEDYVEVQLWCTVISVRIYSVFSLWYFQIFVCFCGEFLDNNGALTGE